MTSVAPKDLRCTPHQAKGLHVSYLITGLKRMRQAHARQRLRSIYWWASTGHGVARSAEQMWTCPLPPDLSCISYRPVDKPKWYTCSSGTTPMCTPEAPGLANGHWSVERRQPQRPPILEKIGVAVIVTACCGNDLVCKGRQRHTNHATDLCVMLHRTFLY